MEVAITLENVEGSRKRGQLNMSWINSIKESTVLGLEELMKGHLEVLIHRLGISQKKWEGT